MGPHALSENDTYDATMHTCNTKSEWDWGGKGKYSVPKHVALIIDKVKWYFFCGIEIYSQNISEGTTSGHYCVPQSTSSAKIDSAVCFQWLILPATCFEIHNRNACIYIHLCWKGLLNLPVVSHILAQVYRLSVYAINSTFEVWREKIILWRKNATIT